MCVPIQRQCQTATSTNEHNGWAAKVIRHSNRRIDDIRIARRAHRSCAVFRRALPYHTLFLIRLFILRTRNGWREDAAINHGPLLPLPVAACLQPPNRQPSAASRRQRAANHRWSPSRRHTGPACMTRAARNIALMGADEYAAHTPLQLKLRKEKLKMYATAPRICCCEQLRTAAHVYIR